MSPDRTPTVVVLGTSFADTEVEERVLAPLGVNLVASPAVDGPDIVEAAAGADVLLIGARPKLDADTIAQLGCKGLVRYGVGVEKLDLEAAAERGMWVANVPRYGAGAVAVHTLSLVLAGIRRLPQADRHVRGGGWGLSAVKPLFAPESLDAGVVGFGRIGSHVASLLGALGFRVHAYDAFVPVPDDAGVAVHETMEALLEACDVVALHTPGRQDGSALLDRGALARMRPGSVLVNTARGSLVDQDALVEGLREGRPAFAALDVFETEPVDPKAFADVEDKVLLTPHMAWYTEESEQDLRRQAAEAAARILQGERPEYVVVDPEAGVRTDAGG